MHAPAPIDYCVFVRIVSRPGPDELLHQGRFAAVAQTRDENGVSLPSHNAGMYKYSTLGVLGHGQLQVRFKNVKRFVQSFAARELGGVPVNQMQATNV